MKDIPWSWVGMVNTVNMSVLPKMIHRFSMSPIKIPKTSFAQAENFTLKFIWNLEGS